MKITFPGKNFAALREDQQAYVQHLMLSWRAFSGMWSDPADLRRAINKAKNNLP